MPPTARGIELADIVLSVKGEEQTKVEALDAGADDYVTKPVGMDELLARVRRNLARTRLAGRITRNEPSQLVISPSTQTPSG